MANGKTLNNFNSISDVCHGIGHNYMSTSSNCSNIRVDCSGRKRISLKNI